MSDTVPLPTGKLLPNLRDCYYPNIPEPQYLSIMLCPNCQSDNVCCLSSAYNPELVIAKGDLQWAAQSSRWFCISCWESWVYGYEK